MKYVVRHAPALLIFLGALCLLVKAFSGSSVDSSGLLREPFFLLPVGTLLIALGAAIWFCRLLLSRRGR